jgi:two-component system sensor histidine kinase KdpD
MRTGSRQPSGAPTLQVLKSKYLLTILSVALATALFLLGRDYFAKGQWALLYLLVISLVARLWGVRPAMLASTLAFLAWNFFFLPPYYTLSISDPKDWLSLLVFLIVGALVGFQTGRMKEREAEALARERDTALLNRFGEHLVSDIEVSDLAKAVGEIAPVVGARCAVLFIPSEIGELTAVGAYDDSPCLNDKDVKKISAWAFSNVKAVGLPSEPARLATGTGAWPISVGYDQAGSSKSRRDVFIPLQSASRLEGVLYTGERQDGRGYSPQEARLLVAIANQSAAFLERKRLHSEAILVDALRESDKMKSVLMSSVSHELKTPLRSEERRVGKEC